MAVSNKAGGGAVITWNWARSLFWPLGSGAEDPWGGAVGFCIGGGVAGGLGRKAPPTGNPPNGLPAWLPPALVPVEALKGLLPKAEVAGEEAAGAACPRLSPAKSMGGLSPRVAGAVVRPRKLLDVSEA